MTGLIVLIVLALIAAFVLFALARVERERTGVPVGAKIVYADTGAWRRVDEPLFSRRYGLTGKPDYVVEQNNAVIPIEVKPNRTAQEPRESDVMQLAAYGLLVKEWRGLAPPYGLLKYRDVVFQIDFNDELYGELLAVMDAMRRDLGEREVARHHAEPARCRACGYRAECGQAMEAEP